MDDIWGNCYDFFQFYIGIAAKMKEDSANKQHKELSSDGIRQLFNPGPNIQHQEFVFQLTKLTEDY